MTILCTLYNEVSQPQLFFNKSPFVGYRILSTPSIQRSEFSFSEGAVRMKINLVDTPGFGNDIDNTDW